VEASFGKPYILVWKIEKISSTPMRWVSEEQK
jgi:hypothetical protein